MLSLKLVKIHYDSAKHLIFSPAKTFAFSILSENIENGTARGRGFGRPDACWAGLGGGRGGPLFLSGKSESLAPSPLSHLVHVAM